MTSATTTLVRASHRDADDLARLIGTAFTGLAVAEWLVTDTGQRRTVLSRNFRIWVDHALEYGEVWTTRDRTGVAVWFPRDPAAPLPVVERYDRRLEDACGRYVDRFRILDAAFDANHPHDTHHHYLAFLAVYPGHRNHGIGGALLDHHHARLDQADTPAYLVASSVDSRRLYMRHGYRDHGRPFGLPDTLAQLWPMWREPAGRRED